jgi:hypothetical protein
MGIATRDLTRAMEALGSGPGSWTVRAFYEDPKLSTPEGPVGWPSENVFSRAGPPYLELIWGPPGSIWHTDELVVAHHLAYWSEAIAEDAGQLESEGWELELSFAGDDGWPSEFAYFTKPGLSRVELVDVRRHEGFLERLRL